MPDAWSRHEKSRSEPTKRPGIERPEGTRVSTTPRGYPVPAGLRTVGRMTLNIAVLIKQVPDLDAVRIDRSSGRPIFSGQLTMSSYDGHAVEEALRLKEAQGGEVTVIAAGPPSARDALTRALAMGVDRGVLVDAPNVNELDTLAVARLLVSQLDGKGFDLILAGQAADDYETGQV